MCGSDLSISSEALPLRQWTKGWN